jgi:multiple sugar transport system permease protein
MWAWALLVPSLALVTALIAYPLATGISLSLHSVVVNRPGLGRPFVGLENYARLLADETVRTALLNTVIYVVVGVISQLLLGLGAAVLLNRSSRLAWVARTAVMLPWFMPPVVAAYMWAFMLDPRYGILTRIAGLLGIDTGSQGVFADPGLALWGVLLVELWRSYPFFALFFLAGLQSIPEELYEAAALDGAGTWHRFRHITLPMLGPTFVFVGVVTMIASFQIFSEPYVMTQGGPLKSTTTLVLLMYEQGFRWWRLGLSAAIAVVLFLLTLAGTLLLRLRRSEAR